MALIRNVMAVANGRDRCGREAPYTCRRKKWCTGMFHSRENSSLSGVSKTGRRETSEDTYQSVLFHQSW